MPTAPLVSIILVTWNSAAHLSRCLSALKGQTFQDFEVILVDNGSTDGALDNLPLGAPGQGLRVERLGSNRGFAAANNVGARLARGTWLALLNSDAFPEPDWLERLLEAAGQSEKDFFASRQIQFHAPHLLDGDGDAYHISGLAWRWNYNLPITAERPRKIFSACGASALYPRQAFLDVGGFDEDYFSYFEDVDLGFRLRLMGSECHFVPEAVVHHVGSASTGKRSDFAVRYGFRNLIWTFLKDMPSPLFWIFLPIHVATVSFFALYYSLRGQSQAARGALFEAARGLSIILKKRMDIQRKRNAKATSLLSAMSIGLLEPYQEFLKRRG